jgi:fructose-1,6-bisphosphatase/inositol monophosphatase family enzyme
MFKDTCLVALGKRVVNLQIIDPGSPHRLGLEIPRTVVALKQDHLIVGHAINQNATNMYYGCMQQTFLEVARGIFGIIFEIRGASCECVDCRLIVKKAGGYL